VVVVVVVVVVILHACSQPHGPCGGGGGGGDSQNDRERGVSSSCLYHGRVLQVSLARAGLLICMWSCRTPHFRGGQEAQNARGGQQSKCPEMWLS